VTRFSAQMRHRRPWRQRGRYPCIRHILLAFCGLGRRGAGLTGARVPYAVRAAWIRDAMQRDLGGDADGGGRRGPVRLGAQLFGVVVAAATASLAPFAGCGAVSSVGIAQRKRTSGGAAACWAIKHTLAPRVAPRKKTLAPH